MDNKMGKFIMAVVILCVIITIITIIVEISAKFWLVSEGVKAVKNAGGLSQIIENIFSFFSK